MFRELFSKVGADQMDRDKDAPLARRKEGDDVAAFVEAAHSVPAPGATGRGRLIFALDATMSRQPTWDLAQALQAKMFETAAASAASRCSLSTTAASTNAVRRSSSPAGRGSPSL